MCYWHCHWFVQTCPFIFVTDVYAAGEELSEARVVAKKAK